jgi:phage-related minor tail protein
MGGGFDVFDPERLGMTSGGNIPKMATGGIVNSPTIAMIGEAGPEAVVPLSRMGSMGGATVNVTINGSVTSEGDLVNAIRNALLQGQNNGQAITKTAIQL